MEKVNDTKYRTMIGVKIDEFTNAIYKFLDQHKGEDNLSSRLQGLLLFDTAFHLMYSGYTQLYREQYKQNPQAMIEDTKELLSNTEFREQYISMVLEMFKDDLKESKTEMDGRIK